MKEELIMKLIDKLLGGTDAGNDKEMIGEYVIVRCANSGVHAGTLKSYEGQEVVLLDSRRLWYWKCADNLHSISGVAKAGIEKTSKIAAPVKVIVLPEACEIISTTEAAEASISGANIHEVN